MRVSQDGTVYVIRDGAVFVRKTAELWSELPLEGEVIVDVAPTVGTFMENQTINYLLFI